MARVILKNISKSFGKTQVVKNIDLEIKDKEFCVLVGPSGCGKTTTLRMVAGLEEITSGEIYIDNVLVNDQAPKDRDIAMVFQSYALYPHMTVYDNMAFGLKLKGYPKEEIKERVEKAAEQLEITRLLKRLPKELSGGQKQRVAVGRCIVRKPKVFLFDEPLSNLDAKLRVQMRAELKKLHQRLQTTIIYVTHDQVEAMTMGDKIVVMKDGIIHQVADPITVYYKPADKFIAGFIGSPPMNFLECKVIKRDNNIYLDEGSFSVRAKSEIQNKLETYLDKYVILGIRPEDIYDRFYYSKTRTEGKTLMASIEVVEPIGSEKYLFLTTGKNTFTARVEAQNKAEVNQDIEVVFDMDKAHVFDKETEKTIL
ncbi:MAG: glycerol-3-phosphate ABC transporter ATP-binding protein [Elusimicrobia bacterium RIFOXYC2_FULL_34_12]|nr:MAG: glycerol-3-phosphate ABC transporter ATP-binding protein [Elusimicrobia bacterium RIFOXYC2_FULL_34_12]OGS39057.1 MAG: glycerol-3-phosphate ABC transporter ATP-binding protein [Elusimicrobia bacterium RIFOXYD2_FULL_34_30]HAM39197.1 glycerol-3-phosphate ABC transporter ATP-binding protein [Elusimicrobiota bacterium]